MPSNTAVFKADGYLHLFSDIVVAILLVEYKFGIIDKILVLPLIYDLSLTPHDNYKKRRSGTIEGI